MKRKQEFNRGDLVFIKPITKPNKSHFRSNCYAIIVGSYSDEYGGSNTSMYSVLLDGTEFCSWYSREDLCLIKRAEPDPIKIMKEYLKNKKRLKCMN